MTKNYDEIFPSLSAIEIQKPNIMTENYVSDSLFSAAISRQSQVVAPIKQSWDKLVVSALSIASEVDPYTPDLPVGTVIRAIDAVDWSMGQRNCDIRPRLVDKASGEARLLDSGSQITVTKRRPEDKVDNSIRLVAVNGTKIDTFGIREIEVKLGRKAYRMPAIICEVQQDILGMDFLKKFKLSMEWDDFDQTELFLVDKKADIKELLQIVTVPTDLPRVHSMSSSRPPGALVSQSTMPSVQSNLSVSDSPSSPSEQAPSPLGVPIGGASPPQRSVDAESVAFQVSCMKKLDEASELNPKKKLTVEEQLKLHEPKYQELIKKYPQLLNPNFVKGTPVHGVYHRIEVDKSMPPCKSKRRPLITNAAKAAAGKAAWDQMKADGIIEEVKPGDRTDYTSALHLVDKPGGGCRPCSDFRLLNLRTVTDAFPLPLLRDFTSKICGAKIFSVVDLRSAFFNIPIWPPHKHYTTTLDPWGGTYVYNRLAFGLASGPSTWQKLLEHTLRDVKNCFIYLDDVLCWGKNKADHDTTLRNIFKNVEKESEI